jgi:hypothetical protein
MGLLCFASLCFALRGVVLSLASFWGRVWCA